MKLKSKQQLLLFDAKEQKWLRFSDPVKILKSDQLEGVESILDHISTYISDGYLAAGFISYEAAPAFDASLEVQGKHPVLPLIWFGIFEKKEVLDELPVPQSPYKVQQWHADIPQFDYKQNIHNIKNYIREGDTYQVNFTYRLNTDFPSDSYPFFYHLAQAQQANYAAYIETNDWAICSASPEQFFELEEGIIRSRPMKGTINRGLTTEEDLELKNWLFHSEKNRSENTMIVDMVRNDVGAIKETSDVNVSEYFRIEKYPTVWQMTSEVQAKTSADISDIFKSLFPPASITGTPKQRTMQIIKNLETSPRGIYTGTIGFITPEKSQFNVAIRTALVDKKNQSAEYGVGGGIIWDSDPEDEWLETLTKAKILGPGKPDFSILESLLYESGKSYFLLEEHLKRMNRSSEYFDFPFNEDEIRYKLESLIDEMNSDCKVRVLLDKNGNSQLEFSPLEQGAKENHAVVLAETPINKHNLFLYHKTTHRSFYNEHMATSKNIFDVILWNEKGELTEGTRTNLLLEINGELFTPPVNCGLLAGTYREYLLQSGMIKEKILKKEDLNKAERIFLINSVRKMVEVKLLD